MKDKEATFGMEQFPYDFGALVLLEINTFQKQPNCFIRTFEHNEHLVPESSVLVLVYVHVSNVFVHETLKNNMCFVFHLIGTKCKCNYLPLNVNSAVYAH